MSAVLNVIFTATREEGGFIYEARWAPTVGSGERDLRGRGHRGGVTGARASGIHSFSHLAIVTDFIRFPSLKLENNHNGVTTVQWVVSTRVDELTRILKSTHHIS